MARGIGHRDGNGTLGGRLTETRVARGMTQQALAELAGTSQAVVQRIETGRCALPRILDAIARALEVEPAWLLFGTRAIEDLEPEAVELARCWARLPAHQRARLRGELDDRLAAQGQDMAGDGGSARAWPRGAAPGLRRTG